MLCTHLHARNRLPLNKTSLFQYVSLFRSRVVSDPFQFFPHRTHICCRGSPRHMSTIFAFAHCFASNSSGGRRRWHNGHVISTISYWSYLWEFPGSSSEHKKGIDVNWLGQRGTGKRPRHQKFCGTSSEVIFHQTSLPKTSSRQAIQLIQPEPVPTCRTCVLPLSSFITSGVASAVTNCPMQHTW